MLKGRALSDQSFQLDSLDGLRGLAVLLVILSHMSNHGIMLFPFLDLSGTGKSGVFLFFVLSSFLLTYPFIVKGNAAIDKAYLLNYAYRRFMRIFPLYLAYLSLALISTYLFSISGYSSSKQIGIPFPLSPDEFIQHLFLQQGKGVTWSIVVEFHYYFLLPFVAFTFAIFLKSHVFLALLTTSALIAASQFVWPQSDTLINDIRLGPYLPVFLIGSCASVIHYRLNRAGLQATAPIRKFLEASGWIAILLLISLIPSVSSLFLDEAIPVQELHKQFLLFSILWAAVLLACTDGTGILRRFFESAFLRYLGFISFSAYLLHVMVPGIATRLVSSPTLQGWIILATTIGIAHVSWLLVERPTSRLRIPTRFLTALKPSQ